MTTEHWPEVALTNDALVAELLLRLKHSSCSDSLNDAPPPSTSITQTKAPKLPYWGHRKNRSKSTVTITKVSTGIGKEHRGSPTTHLSWSGGGGSTSDGYDESSRPSDLSSGGRSVKANEGASTSSCYNKSHKRKTFGELKDEEGSLLKERIHINRELASMRVTLNQEMARSENLKRAKIDFDQGQTMVDEERKKASMMAAQSCRVEAHQERGFVLPDLNMTPTEEDAAAMMS